MTPESAQDQYGRMIEEKEQSIPSKESIEALMADNKNNPLPETFLPPRDLTEGGNARIRFYSKPSRGRAGEIWGVKPFAEGVGGDCQVVPDTGHQLGKEYVAPILAKWCSQ